MSSLSFIKKRHAIRISFLLLLLAFTITLIDCSGTKSTKKSDNSLKKSKYFRILADADDDPIFIKLQDDLGIDPKMERYTVVVDIRSNESAMQTVLFGDEYNPARFSWSQLSDQVRTGLINWTGSNKENLE
jgi:hypothetical protein